MPFFKHYYLLEPSKYEQYKSFVQKGQIKQECNTLEKLKDDVFTHPNVSAVYKLDNEMKNILSSNALTDQEKVDRYNEKLGLYLKNFRSALETPKNEALIGNRPQSSLPINNSDDDKHSNNDDSKMLKIQETVFSLPKTYQRRAKGILKRLNSPSSSIRVQPSGAIAYNNDVIPDSDIDQLLNAAVRYKKAETTHIPGYEQFLNAVQPKSLAVTRKKVQEKPTKRLRTKSPGKNTVHQKAKFTKKLRWEELA